MKRLRMTVGVSVLALAGVTAWAQGGGPGPGMQGGGPGPGMQGGGPMASAPGPGMPSGRGPGARAGADYTPGWAMMTREERAEHHARLRDMHSYEECRSYLEQHRAQMAERAKSQGGKALQQPRRDPCAGLQR